MRCSAKLTLSLAISLLALSVAQRASADNGYEPYYYGGGAVQTSPIAPIDTVNGKPPVVQTEPTVAQAAPQAISRASYRVPSAPPSFEGEPLITPRSADIHPVASSSQQKLSSAPPPYADENNNAGPQIDIHTDKGGEIGAQVSDYHYQEHDVANAEYMHQTGVKFGATLKGTETFNYGLFLSGDLRFAYSKNDYWSAPSGTINSFAGDFLGEGRVLIGEDLIFGDKPQSEVSFALAPYTGIGVRDLYNDSSKIKGGYRRNSEYFYVPLGLTDRFRITSNARISLNGEFDYLLLGRQTSYLNDATYNDPNVTNDQKHGYGVRGSIMYERESWAIGPFANYWNVNQSDYSIYKGTSCLPYYCGIWEPHNQTYEVGGEIRYRF